MTWKSFPHYCPFVRGIHRWPVDSPHKGPVMRNFDVPLYPPLATGDRWIPLTSAGDAHDDVIKWKQFPRNWPFVRGIHRSPVNSPHKGQWRGALMFSLICVRMNDWMNNHEAGDLRRYRTHYDVIVIGALMFPLMSTYSKSLQRGTWGLNISMYSKCIWWKLLTHFCASEKAHQSILYGCAVMLPQSSVLMIWLNLHVIRYCKKTVGQQIIKNKI